MMAQRRRLVRLSVVLWLTCTCSSASVLLSATQRPSNQVPPVFRSGAYLVFVDAYPRRDGHVVEGLTAPDFTVLEDGKPQTVEIFEFIESPASLAARGAPPLAAAAPPLPGRLFILYLNRYFLTMEGTRKSPEPLVSFLREVIGPKDLVSWHSPDQSLGSLTFGQSLDNVDDALRRYWRQIHDESPYAGTPYEGVAFPVAQSPYENRLIECYMTRRVRPEQNIAIVKELLIRSRIEIVLKSLEELVGRVSSFGEPRVHVLLVSGAWALPREGSTKDAWGAEGPNPVDPRLGLPGQPKPDARATNRAGCDAEYVRLQTMDAADRFRDLTQRAIRSNVSFVTVDPYGLGSVDPFASKPMGSGSLNLLRTLAETTGGLASVGVGDLSASMRDLAKGVSSYYLLGYYSTNTQFNGRYRTIDVKVAQPGVTVSARRGYTPPRTLRKPT
jgi:VWFA-related protein